MPNNFPILVGGAAPEPTSGDYLVRFIDFDGTILKEQWVNAGQAATAPTPPTHQYLTFDEWNNTFTNVQHDLDVGATYYTTDGKTYLFMRFTNTTGLQPAIYLNKADTSLMTINWGDGTSQTTSASGNVAITKAAPYAAIGDYIITIECAAGYSFYSYILGNNAYKNTILKCYCSNNITSIGTLVFYQCYSFSQISLPNSLNSIGAGAFYQCFSLISLIIPSGISIIDYNTFYQCVSLRSVVIPSTINSIGNRAFYQCFCLIILRLPNILITLGDECFSNCSSLISINLPSGISVIPTNLFYQTYAIREITLPDGTTQINILSLYKCYSLELLSIPYAVNIIAAGAFNSCISILQYEFLVVIPPSLADTNAFSSINLACKIYVPDASVSAYQAATNWNTYASYIYPISELAEYAGTIFFQSNGGNAIKQITGTVGAVATEPTAPTKTGFTFAGWYKEAALTNAWNWASDVYPATNITLYAKWI